MRAEAPVIIFRPERQSGAQRITFGVLTLTIWAVWLYLWLPLVTALLWMAGIRTAYLQIFNGKRGVGLNVIFWIMLAAVGLVTYWSNYNRIRYTGSTRRQRAPAVPKILIGEKFGVTDAATLSLLSQKRRLNLYFNDAGTLIHVEIPMDS